MAADDVRLTAGRSYTMPAGETATLTVTDTPGKESFILIAISSPINLAQALDRGDLNRYLGRLAVAEVFFEIRR